MQIRRAIESDQKVLLELWLRSVRATHDFLAEEDIQNILPLVRDHALIELEIWVLIGESGIHAGFMGMADNKIEALFLAPDFFRRGGGSQLVRHAESLQGRLLVDVNEQNSAARAFYEALGFVVESRSEVDSSGRPFPILHMRQREA